MSLKISSLGIVISPFMAAKSNIVTEHTPKGSVVSTIGKEIDNRCEKGIAPDPPRAKRAIVSLHSSMHL
jgi:hypothetical protein